MTKLVGVAGLIFIAFSAVHFYKPDPSIERAAEQRARLQAVAEQFGAKRKLSDEELLELHRTFVKLKNGGN